MNAATTKSGRPRGWRRISTWSVVTAAVFAIAAAWWLLARGAGEDAAAADQARTGSGEAMAGMDMGGMDMAGTGGGGEIRLSADQVRDFGVTFGTVEVRALEDVVRTVGVLGLDETKIAAVTARFDGYVEELHVDFTGRRVRAGERLAEVYSPELLAAQEELLLAARLERELPRSPFPGTDGRAVVGLVEAARERLVLQGVSDAQIDEVLESGRSRRTLTLYAPVAGVVIEKTVLDGQAVTTGQTLYTIADLGTLWVDVEVREADAALVREGDEATVELASLPGRPIPGRIEYVYPTLQEASRTLRARVALLNPSGTLRPGMYATVRIRAPGRSALTVPASAVLDTGERRMAFVDMGAGRMKPQDVEVGRVSGDLAEVLSGLEPGQRVVTSAQYLLDSESNLADVMRSMIAQMNTSDMGSMDMQGGSMPGMDMPATPFAADEPAQMSRPR